MPRLKAFCSLAHAEISAMECFSIQFRRGKGKVFVMHVCVCAREKKGCSILIDAPAAATAEYYTYIFVVSPVTECDWQ